MAELIVMSQKSPVRRNCLCIHVTKTQKKQLVPVCKKYIYSKISGRIEWWNKDILCHWIATQVINI